MHHVGGTVSLVQATVMGPVMLVRELFHGIVLILAVICAFNAMRGWYRCRGNRLDYSLGGAMVYLMMCGVLTGLLLIDQFVGFENII